MNINKTLQLVSYLLFLTTTIGLLLAIITTWHLPATAVWVVLTITAAIVCTMVIDENPDTINQKEVKK